MLKKWIKFMLATENSADKIKRGFATAGVLKRLILLIELAVIQILNILISLPVYLSVNPKAYHDAVKNGEDSITYRLRRMIIICLLAVVLVFVSVKYAANQFRPVAAEPGLHDVFANTESNDSFFTEKPLLIESVAMDPFLNKIVIKGSSPAMSKIALFMAEGQTTADTSVSALDGSWEIVHDMSRHPIAPGNYAVFAVAKKAGAIGASAQPRNLEIASGIASFWWRYVNAGVFLAGLAAMFVLALIILKFKNPRKK